LEYGANAAFDGDYRTRRRRLVALCPEVDVASQGSSIQEARANLIEALTLFSK
jgi:hypothetical protein